MLRQARIARDVRGGCKGEASPLPAPQARIVVFGMRCLMSDELAARLARLRRKLTNESDPEEQADLAAAIEALAQKLSSQQAQVSIGADVQAGDISHSDMAGRDQIGQLIAGEATVGVAVAGNVHGNVHGGGTHYEALLQIFFQSAGLREPGDEQQELLRSYLDGLIRRHDQLRLSGVVTRERTGGKVPAFTLSQVYVTLASEEWESVAQSASAEEFAEQVRAGNADEVLPQQVRRIVAPIGQTGFGRSAFQGNTYYVLERPLLLTTVVSARRRVVLLGGPGSGKSSFLRHLAVTLARGEAQSELLDSRLPGWTAGFLLPLYASLGTYASWAKKGNHDLNPETLWDFLASNAEHDSLAGLRQQLRRAFRNGGLLLLLDGLDEVADPTLRASVASAVAELGTQQHGFLVVTCRERSFSNNVAVPFAAWGQPVHIAPFSPGQISHFIRSWYAHSIERGAFDSVEAVRRADDLIEHIRSITELRDLGQTPLLLTIITILHYYEGKLPEDRADLYEDLVQLLLTRWTVQRRERDSPQNLLEMLAIPGLKEFHLRGVLENLAYQAHQGERSTDGRGLLDLAIVREAFTRLFEQLGQRPGVAYEQARMVLDYLEIESGLLLHEGGDQYALPHLTYEEYLAGCYLVKQETYFQRLAYNHWRTDPTRWREVLLLALGRMVRTDKRETAAAWLQFLVSSYHGQRLRDVAELQTAALLAADSLADLGGVGALYGVETIDLPMTFELLAKLLAAAVEGATLPARERVRAGRHLSTLGDPRPGVGDFPPAMVDITSDSFVIGSSHEEVRWANDQYKAQYEQPLDIASRQLNTEPMVLAPFALARYLVTNRQYEQFVDDGGYDPQAPWWDVAGRAWLNRDDDAVDDLKPFQRRRYKDRPEFWDTSRFGIARPNHPVVGVTWYEAMAFCTWLTLNHAYNPEGYRYQLPSEAEWEYAARGRDRRVYPWGNDAPDPERANFGDAYNGTTPVGAFPAGATPKTGLLDMAGNVWEWTRSEFRQYPYNREDGREAASNPAQRRFTIRGGAWYDLPIGLHGANRDHHPPDFYVNVVGFRLRHHRA